MSTTTDGYLPMDCPRCERRRLMPTIVTTDEHGDMLDFPFVSKVECEKCRYEWPDEASDT